jgi:enediyne biosynthesis protein CalE5
MPTAEDLTKQQKMQWSAAAAGWERQDGWFEQHSRDLSGWLCEAVGIGPAMHTLDVACGAGQPAVTAAQRVTPEGHVTAIDLSPDMVAVTRRKAQRLGLDHLEAQEMDTQSLIFVDDTFDGATCRFGLMFCPDPVRGASEIRRVLKPKARFATAVWDVPAKNPFFTAIAGVLAEFVPGPPPDPAAPGVFRLAPPGELERVLRAAGFSDVSVEARPLVLTYGSREQYWQIQIDLAAPLRAAMAALGPEGVGRVKARVFEAIAPNVEGGVVKFAAVPLCASATK